MWEVIFERKAQKQFNALDSQIKKRIAKFIDERLIPSNNPRELGRAACLCCTENDHYRYVV